MKVCAIALQPGDVLVSFRSPVIIAVEVDLGDIQNCVNLNTTNGYFTFPFDLTVEIEDR